MHRYLQLKSTPKNIVAHRRRQNKNEPARSLYMIAYLLLLTFCFDIRRKSWIPFKKSVLSVQFHCGIRIMHIDASIKVLWRRTSAIVNFIYNRLKETKIVFRMTFERTIFHYFNVYRHQIILSRINIYIKARDLCRPFHLWRRTKNDTRLSMAAC